MKEIRIDELTGDRVIYTSYRNKRPHDKLKNTTDFDDKDKVYNESCPFCRGNEVQNDDLKEIIMGDDGWVAKSVANKFPIVSMDSNEVFGEHEVIVESHRHNASFYNMTMDEFKNVFSLFKSRYSALESREGIEFVGIFKNYKRGSGASLMHPHSQIVSLNIMPPEIEKELKVSNDYKKENDKNLYEMIVDREISLEERVIHNGDEFLVFVPHATRYNGEIRIIEKSTKSIKDWSEQDIVELAYIFKNLFIGMDKYMGDIPFNILVHSVPNDKDGCGELRTHFHIVPRKYNFGGFELCTNLFVCGSDPKDIASEFRF